MTQAEFISRISGDSGIPRKDVERVLDSVGKTVQSALASGDTVALPGVGKLSVADRAARTGMNPATGAKVDIPAKRVAKLKAGAELTRALAA